MLKNSTKVKELEALDRFLNSAYPHFQGLKTTQAPQDRLAPYLDCLKIDLKKLPPIIHAVGTNGKGSVLHYIKTALSLRGKTCHRYTSPHLIHYTERIEIGGAPILPQLFYEQAELLLKYPTIYELSFFDFLTLIALNLFQINPADFCLLEAGLGGRLDSTNLAYPQKIYRVITSISLDHQKELSESLDQIIAEKRAVIQDKDEVFDIRITDARVENLALPFIQKENLSQALSVSESILKTEFTQDEIQIIAKTQWIGRYQNITQAMNQAFQFSKLGHQFYIDGAHNLDGIKKLIQYFGYDNTSYIVRPNLKKENWQKIIAQIHPNHLYLAEPHSNQWVEWIKSKQAHQFIFCGSLYWVGEILSALQNKGT